MLLEDEMNVPRSSACGTELRESLAHVPTSSGKDMVSSVSVSTEDTQVLSEILEVPNEVTMDVDVGQDTQAALVVPACADNSTETIIGKHILELVLESRLPIDTVIVCSDGKIGAHRLVLAAASPFLGLLFEDQRLGEVAVVLLPDLKKSTVEILLNIAYTGVMVFPPEKEEELFAAMELLLFCHNGNLEMNMVTVKLPQPEVPIVPVPVAGPSRERDIQPTNSGTRKRVRTETGTPLLGKLMKKIKYDENCNRIQLARRTGTPVGKETMVKLRKREERRIIQNSSNTCKPPFLNSDHVTNTVRVNIRRIPFTSIRLEHLRIPSKNECSLDSTTSNAQVRKHEQHRIEVEPIQVQEQTSLSESKVQTSLTGPEPDTSSGIHSNGEGESELTDSSLPFSRQSNLNPEMPTAGGSSILKNTENEDNYSNNGSLPCSDLDRMDLAFQPRQRTRRSVNQS